MQGDEGAPRGHPSDRWAVAAMATGARLVDTTILPEPVARFAYVGGHGLMKVGPSAQTGVGFDQAALIALWGEALGFPSAWEDAHGFDGNPVTNTRLG